MREYWVSTPHWTCWVQVQWDGLIVDAASYLRRTVRGKQRWRPWGRQLRQRYGAALQVVRL